MAGSSEADLLTNIGKQINEFSENAHYADNVKGRPIPTAESTLRLSKQTENELWQMKEEIKNLEKKVKIRKLDKRQKLKLLNDKEKLALSAEREPGDVKKEIRVLENELKLLKDITGFHIKKTECNVVNIERAFIERSYRVEGSCNGIDFRLIFTVKETWEKGADSVSKIEGLQVKFSDKTAEETLRQVVNVSLLESGGSVTLLVHVINAFGQWRQNRKRVVSSLYQLYPDFVLFNSDEQLIFTPSAFKGAEFVFEWQLVFSECYKASSRVTLVVNLPQDVADLDDDDILKHAPSLFNEMQQTLGIGPAIVAIFRTLCP